MDATESFPQITKEFIGLLSRDYSEFAFSEGKQEHWSPKNKTIYFNPGRSCYGVLYKTVWILIGIGCIDAVRALRVLHMSYKATLAIITVITARLVGMSAAAVLYVHTEKSPMKKPPGKGRFFLSP
jgi:hypothetical protein